MPSLRVPRMRYLRKRLRNGFGRLRRVEDWFDSRSTALSGTGTAQIFTVVAGTDVFTIASHGYSTGDGPVVFTTIGTIPDGIDLNQLYWPRVIDSNTFTVHLNQDDAFNNLRPLDVTSAGVGDSSMVPATTSLSLVEKVRQDEVTTNTLNTLDDIDDITP